MIEVLDNFVNRDIVKPGTVITTLVLLHNCNVHRSISSTTFYKGNITNSITYFWLIWFVFVSDNFIPASQDKH